MDKFWSYALNCKVRNLLYIGEIYDEIFQSCAERRHI